MERIYPWRIDDRIILDIVVVLHRHGTWLRGGSADRFGCLRLGLQVGLLSGLVVLEPVVPVPGLDPDYIQPSAGDQVLLSRARLSQPPRQDLQVHVNVDYLGSYDFPQSA